MDIPIEHLNVTIPKDTHDALMLYVKRTNGALDNEVGRLIDMGIECGYKKNPNLEHGCAYCNSQLVEEKSKEEIFKYGEAGNQVELKATVIVSTCSACNESYTDYRAEEARNHAVQMFLQSGSSQ